MSEIIKIRIHNELDVVLAYKRAMQLSLYTGMNVSSQTKFATAVSEICRNVVEHVGEGLIVFNLINEGQWQLEAMVIDRGRGIKNVEELLERNSSLGNTKGCGILNSRKLVDSFLIYSKPDHGTTVQMRKKIPRNHLPINKSIIEGWKDHFEKEEAISPYEEIKKQNLHLIELMENLHLKHMQAEEQINEIQRLNKDLDKFAYTVSHDLKAPLKNIQGIILLMQDSLEIRDFDDVKNCCEILRNQAHKMDDLIQGILSYAKQGKQSIVKTEVEVARLINDILTSLQVPKTFNIRIGADLPVILTEEVLLHQVFLNLISNAIKYSDKDGGMINIGCIKEDSGIIFFVEDDGPGISPSDAKKIFKLFESLSKQSSGIGLSIVHNIVTEKGGKVWMESNGRGSKFFFTWPDGESKRLN